MSALPGCCPEGQFEMKVTEQLDAEFDPAAAVVMQLGHGLHSVMALFEA